MNNNGSEEIWKEIPGFEGHYSASNLGRIKSHERTCQARYVRRVRERILTNHINQKNGHGNNSISVTAKLSNTAKGSLVASVGRLVLVSFVGEPEEKNAVVHFKDGNPKNANLENLEWSTYSKIGKECRYTPPPNTKRDEHGKFKADRQNRHLNQRIT